MHEIILGHRVISPLTISMNLATRMASVNRGGQGLSVVPFVDPIGQQLTNMAAATAAMHGLVTMIDQSLSWWQLSTMIEI